MLGLKVVIDGHTLVYFPFVLLVFQSVDNAWSEVTAIKSSDLSSLFGSLAISFFIPLMLPTSCSCTRELHIHSYPPFFLLIFLPFSHSSKHQKKTSTKIAAGHAQNSNSTSSLTPKLQNPNNGEPRMQFWEHEALLRRSGESHAPRILRDGVAINSSLIVAIPWSHSTQPARYRNSVAVALSTTHVANSPPDGQVRPRKLLTRL